MLCNDQDLPSGWVWSKVKDLCTIIRGVSYPKDQVLREYTKGYYPILRAGNIQDNLVFGDLVFVPRKYIKDEQFIKKLDIVIAMSSGSKDIVGKAAQAKEDYEGGFGAFCSLLRVNRDYINPSYFGYYFRTKDYRTKISLLSAGVNINNLRKGYIENLDIPIPPLAEQERIVHKTERLFICLNKTKEELAKIPPILRKFRQSVLARAFNGELTKEWREQQKDLEPASVLLERIRAERKRELSKKYKEPKPIDASDLPALPEGWEWTRVSDLYDIVGGGTPSTKKAAYWRGRTPWITSADIKGLKRITVRKFITKEAIQQSAANPVPAGSIIVVTRVGLGKVALTSQEMCFSQDCQALTPSNYLFSEYILWFLARATQLFLYASRGSTIEGVTKRQVAELAVAIPSYKEQQEIVRVIERLNRQTDMIENSIGTAQVNCSMLTQSILAKAFRGELVPQDPSDEPAEKLLEIIKTEKSRTTKTRCV